MDADELSEESKEDEADSEEAKALRVSLYVFQDDI
jgi:hypothetical protein